MIEALVLLLSFLLLFLWGFLTTWNIEILGLQWVNLIIQQHRNSINTQQKTALWKCRVSECYLFYLTLFSSLTLESVNLEKHSTSKTDIDLFELLGFFLWNTNIFLKCCNEKIATKTTNQKEKSHYYAQ